ncbi:MAG: hypothetical protein ACI9FZ_000435 [Bacteroidia bacterium]
MTNRLPATTTTTIAAATVATASATIIATATTAAAAVTAAATVTTATTAAAAVTAAAVATATTAATAAVTAAAATTWTFFAWTCLIDRKIAAHEICTIQRFDCCVHGFFSFHSDKCEATRATRFTIFYDENIANCTMSFEKRLEFFLSYIVGQVAYIHFCIHYVFLFFTLFGLSHCFFALECPLSDWIT